jgi:hypothetical protein
MFPIYVFELWLYALLNLLGCTTMIEVYEFTIGKDESGKPVIGHGTTTFPSGGAARYDTLIIDPTITVEPTKESYDFMTQVIEELVKHLNDTLTGPSLKDRQHHSVEFEERKDITDLQGCLQNLIFAVVNEFNSGDEYARGMLNMIFVIKGTTWVISQSGTEYCPEVIIRDETKWPIVAVSEKMTSRWESDASASGNQSSRSTSFNEKWINFEEVDVYFPIFE